MRDALHELLCCPSCGGDLVSPAFTCAACKHAYPAPSGIPDLRPPADAPTDEVRRFYDAAPFPGYPPRLSLSALRARAARSELARLLDAAIPPGARVADVGCGTGQMSLFLATGDRFVVGADLTRASLELGAAAARRFDLGPDRVRFVETDLSAPALRPGSFDVVYCSGVLHHTPDPRAAFARVARLARPGGFVVVGLYNTYARLPHRLRRGLARLTGWRFIPFDPVLRDRRAEPARREAWLRDQYRHPLEHRHSLGEVIGWFRESRLDYVRAYPSSVIAEEPLSGGQLFEPAGDDWAPERLLVQLGWHSIWHEGGLFVTIGRAQECVKTAP